jgi:hypothetical protein
MTEMRLAETTAKSIGSVRPELADLIKLLARIAVDDFIEEEKAETVIKDKAPILNKRDFY